jgi:hypothetical protein
MLGTSCKKIVLQLALQDIGQLTDFEARAAQIRHRFPALPGQPSRASRAGPVSRG